MLTAEKAKKLADHKNKEELNHVLDMILNESKKEGKYLLHIYDPLEKDTIKELKSRGFEVVDHPSISKQRDSLYYTIKW